MSWVSSMLEYKSQASYLQLGALLGFVSLQMLLHDRAWRHVLSSGWS